MKINNDLGISKCCRFNYNVDNQTFFKSQVLGQQLNVSDTFGLFDRFAHQHRKPACRKRRLHWPRERR